MVLRQYEICFLGKYGSSWKWWGIIVFVLFSFSLFTCSLNILPKEIVLLFTSENIIHLFKWTLKPSKTFNLVSLKNICPNYSLDFRIFWEERFSINIESQVIHIVKLFKLEPVFSLTSFSGRIKENKALPNFITIHFLHLKPLASINITVCFVPSHI